MTIPSVSVFRGPLNTVDSSLTNGTAIGAHVIRYLDGFDRYLNPTQVPFTESTSKGGSVNQKKVEWGTSFLAPNQATLGAALADGVGTSVTLAAGDGAKFMVTDLFKIESEVFWVTAILGDTLTVKRAMGDTTGAAHTLNDTTGQPRIIDILSPAAQENADTPLAPIAKGGLEYNLVQRFDYGIQIDNRENVTPDYEFDLKGGATKYEALLQKRMKEAAIKFEKTLIRGRRGSETSAVIGTGTPSQMGGLDFFTDTVVNLSGAPISESVLLDTIQDVWTRVGEENTPSQIICGPFVRRALSSLWNANRYSTVTDTKTTLSWTSIDTDFGPLRFTLSRYIDAGVAYLIDTSDISRHPYKNGDWQEERLPSNGPYVKGRFTGDYTAVFRGNQKRRKFANISVTATDYGNM